MGALPHNAPDLGYMGDRSRGAGMGRPSITVVNLDPTHKLSLTKVPLDSGGYDRGGAYWGRSQTLWCAVDHRGGTHYFRERSRERAKQYLRDKHDAPELLQFYR